MAANVYYSDGTMDDVNNLAMRDFHMASGFRSNEQPQIPMNGLKTWRSAEIEHRGEEVIRTLVKFLIKNRNDVEIYCEVSSNFVNGVTNGYTVIKKCVFETGSITKTIVEEGYHKSGKKVGRISIEATYIDIDHNIDNNLVLMKYEEFNDDHQIEYIVNDDKISFYQKDIKYVSYSNTKTCEQLYFNFGEVVYLRIHNTSEYSTINRYGYSKFDYIRRITNDTGIVEFTGKEYLLDGTITNISS